MTHLCQDTIGTDVFLCLNEEQTACYAPPFWMHFFEFETC